MRYFFYEEKEVSDWDDTMDIATKLIRRGCYPNYELTSGIHGDEDYHYEYDVGAKNLICKECEQPSLRELYAKESEVEDGK